MALDTRYRPNRYEDVLGQEASVAVLKQFVVEGRGFHQSYVFCGQHGSGKTTLGRILARALLCESPVDGAPCDQCESCQTFLSGDTHECFEELDAATKSGKADLARIIEDLQYSTVSGKRRIYLFDESHRLSKQALDALLKPMEDSAPGSEDKRLVCIFCTTEPERMVNTIFSRCAPAFVIRSAPMEAIASRLAYICDQEAIKYENDALMLISEQSGSHIRDAIKLVEGVSMLGGLTRANVSKYLHFDTNDLVLDLLEALGADLPKAVTCATGLSATMSPSAVYERLAEDSMLLYRAHLGVADIPRKWDGERIAILADKGSVWLATASRFAAPPHRPTKHTLLLDVATSHHCYGTEVSGPVQVVVAAPTASTSPISPTTPTPTTSDEKPISPSESTSPVKAGTVGHGSSKATSRTTAGGVYVDERGVGRGPADRAGADLSEGTPGQNVISAATFTELVRHHLREMMGGRKRRNNVADR